MRKIVTFFFFSLLILLSLNGCYSNEVLEKEDLFQYKNSFVGDAGAIGNITRRLPNPSGEQISGLELQTSEEPYGIILDYISVENSDAVETNYKELSLYNATFILSLVKNADWVTFNFIEQEVRINRVELQNFYGKDIREFNKKAELSRFIQSKLEDENGVNEFFN
ncbi:DUF4825 domain-containing protein [Bacillus sp. AK031]